ncbi:MAG TPA: pyrroline-5-carboxylate reductase [Dehalococcoidia bacterium]|jgi:pyrroline-5-carboxylate reductase|nr:pyrroline-5-carboxylate reductase [Dehalococcoidia bacterium]
MNMQIGFIGGGVMAEAIISGMTGSGIVDCSDVMASDLYSTRRGYLKDTYGIEVTDNNTDVIEHSSIIFVAVKPQDIPNIGVDIASSVASNQTVVSIAAGISINQMAEAFKTPNLIRVMPNTPAQVKSGMSVWMSTGSVSEAHVNMVKKILDGIGKQYQVFDEKYIDMATGLSASGPAYILMIIDALVDAGVFLGMPRAMSKMLAVQMIKGTSELVESSDLHLKELSDMVVSPGGTTAAGLLVLESQGIPHALIRAVEAAYNKALELGN